jgi:uncharacterized protein (DUF433 family)
MPRGYQALGDLAKIAQSYTIPSRTYFQLKHFVIGQHDTPEMQYRQIIIEVKDLLFKIRSTEIVLKKEEILLKRLEESNDEMDLLEAESKRLGMAVTRDTLEGGKREFNYLCNLAKDYPHYSPDDIEAAQETYWRQRLNRQASIDQLSADQRVSVGNLHSMHQAGLLPKELEV